MQNKRQEEKWGYMVHVLRERTERKLFLGEDALKLVDVLLLGLCMVHNWLWVTKKYK